MNDKLMIEARERFIKVAGLAPTGSAFDAGWRAASPPMPRVPEAVERERLMVQPVEDYMAQVAATEGHLSDGAFSAIGRHVRAFWRGVREQGLVRAYGQRVHPAYSVKVGIMHGETPDLIALYAHTERDARALAARFNKADLIAIERWDGSQWVEVAL